MIYFYSMFFNVELTYLHYVLQKIFIQISKILISNRKMVDFSFDGLFKTTNMGIPSLSPLPTQTSLSKSYYGYSITVQSIILLYFVAYFGLSIIRVIKKLKNQKFRDLEEELIQLQDGHNNKEYVISQQKTQKNTYSQGKQEGQDNRPKLIPYRFDGEQEQKNRKRQRLRHLPEMDKDKEGIDDENKVIEENNEDYNSYHDEKEQYYIQLDNKLMFLQPFLISFIICNNMFVADIITVLAMVLMFLSYYLFNVKECLSNIKITPLLFMLFSLFGYISFFINDHDLTT